MNPPADNGPTIRTLGRRCPGRRQRGDIGFGLPLLEAVAALGIGGAIVVSERDIIAVEAAEGIDALIERAGRLCRCRGWTLLIAAPAAVNAETARAVAAAGGRCVGIVGDAAALGDVRAVIAAADRASVALVALQRRN